MASRRPPLRLEELGSRVLPSASPLPFAVPPAAPALVRSESAVVLNGDGHGTYTADQVISGAGRQYQLDGTADLADLGCVRVEGSLHGVGFIQQGRAGGTITFSNKKGSVTVELVGPKQAAFSPLPLTWHYEVVAHTGDFGVLSAAGTVRLALHEVSGGESSGPHGTFSLNIGWTAAV